MNEHTLTFAQFAAWYDKNADCIGPRPDALPGEAHVALLSDEWNGDTLMDAYTMRHRGHSEVLVIVGQNPETGTLRSETYMSDRPGTMTFAVSVQPHLDPMFPPGVPLLCEVDCCLMVSTTEIARPEDDRVLAGLLVCSDHAAGAR